MSVIATTNTQHYENIADGLRTAGDLSNYRSELAVDAEIFEDISDALQSKTGQQEPYAKDELAQAVSNLPTDLIPKTITENGVYNASSDNADGYDVVTVDVLERNTLDEYFADTLEVANIPSATSIPFNMFNSKTFLVNVTMPNVTAISNRGFENCTSLALTSLPSGITSIGEYAFNNCISLALTSLPSGITSIGEYAFNNCISLALTSLPSGITNLPRYAFCACTNLAITSLPSGVTNIGGATFASCASIPYLDFSAFNNIPTVQKDTFFNTAFPFYFRDQQQLDEWAAATNWSTYADRFQIKPSGVI